tara:strand:+ start:771 stop:1397 length:627 start_codon:yes stop_codon:yes gene_type:complete
MKFNLLNYFFIKGIFDNLAAFFLILLTSPLLLLIYSIILWQMGRPVFFLQARPGYKSKRFKIIKFRTMTNLNNYQNEIPDKDRLTKFGKFLRSSSLDELPELINILKGEMSFVGPRPLLNEYLDLYTPEQLKRHDVKPGFTGYAQINGRNLLSWEEKFEYDLLYVNNQNFLLDLKIILKTFKIVFSRKGISAKGEATMYKFIGSNKTK